MRVEEFINYFQYDYPKPKDEHPLAIYTELSNCPWNKNNRLLHIGIKGKELEIKNQKASNLVFLIDVSGSYAAGKQIFRCLKGLLKCS